MKKSERWGILGAVYIVIMVAGFYFQDLWWLFLAGLAGTAVCLYYLIKRQKEEEAEPIQEEEKEP